MKKVLIFDKDNSCRGQMAYGYLKLFAGHKAEIYCLGIDNKHLDPRAIAILMEEGINISENKPLITVRYKRYVFDYILILSDRYDIKHWRINDTNAIRIHHTFDNPARVKGSDENIYKAYERTRDEIRVFCKDFVKTHLRLIG